MARDSLTVKGGQNLVEDVLSSFHVKTLANKCQQLKGDGGATPLCLQDLVYGVAISIPTAPTKHL
jgi:hypothetical protein